MIELKSPALVIIDMQNGFCHPEGTFGKLGMPTSNHLDIVPTINRLRKQSHDAHIPVFFTRLEYNKDYSNAGIQFEDQPHMRDLGAFVQGTWDAQIIDDLTPNKEDPNEIVISKTRNTAFWGTGFQAQLQSRGINQLFVTGVGTNVCVESTVRDAVTNDIYTKTVSDATATLSAEDHQASLKNLQWFGGVVSADELLKALAEHKA